MVWYRSAISKDNTATSRNNTVTAPRGVLCRRCEPAHKEEPMKKLSILCALAGTTLLCGFPVSLQLSPQGKLSISFDGASAEIGRPWTAASIAGVGRRTARRAARRAYYADQYGYGYGSGYGYGPGYGYGVGAAALATTAAATTTVAAAPTFATTPAGYDAYAAAYGGGYAGGV